MAGTKVKSWSGGKAGSNSFNDESLSSAETWDPVSGAFSAAGDMGAGRTNGSATLLPDGRVLIAGGHDHRHSADRTGLPVFTKNTIRDLGSLTKELDRVRKLGYAFDNEEAEKGVSCIGAGIHDDEGRLIAGLSLSAPSNRIDKAWGLRVKEVADQISRALGHRLGMKTA